MSACGVKAYGTKKFLTISISDQTGFAVGWDSHSNLPVKDSSCVLTILSIVVFITELEVNAVT
jgi:hypothetical protein